MTRQHNFDRDFPGAGQLVRTPAAAARRAAASQRLEPGAAASPSEPARIAKARAGEQAASAALPAEDVTVADTAGARRPSRVEASAHAAASRAASQAPRGRVTAAAGNASIDLGRPQIASQMGDGRASGGGEPTLGDLRAGADRQSRGQPRAAGAAVRTGDRRHARNSQPAGRRSLRQSRHARRRRCGAWRARASQRPAEDQSGFRRNRQCERTGGISSGRCRPRARRDTQLPT